MPFPDAELLAKDATLRDYFAAHAPQPPEWWMKLWQSREQAKSRRDDRYVERSLKFAIAEHAYEHANAMMETRFRH